MRVSKPLRQALLLAFALMPCAAMAQNVLPSGGTVVGGAANITQSGASQIINQTTGKAIIDWQSFSIGAGNSVRVNQPGSSSILLNRVVGGNPSSILGNLSSNGQIFLVNPFGVYFGAGATVDVGGLLATTLDIGNDDFMTGNFVFNRNSLSAARREVINQGVLKARDNGYIVLAGDYAANKGIIQARLGTAALASGNQMTLDIQGDSLISVAVNQKTVTDLSGVENSGQILADGGRAIMTAAVARDLTTAAVNNSGLIQAQSTVESNGEIYLSSDGGNTLNSGTLDASGKAAGQTGGNIKVLGDKVALTDNALLDASGDAGGGQINVGGNYQGKGPLQNSQTNYIGQNVQIKADALANGNGGKVVVWSDDWTRYYGSITAKGGAQGGDGGSVEVSGKQLLDFNGKVNTLATNGQAGTLLLDPSDIEVVTSTTSDITGSSPFQDATDNGGTSQMTVGNLETALGSGNVIIKTSTSSGTAPKGGTITIDDGSGGGVQWSTGNSLTLQADNQIIINSNVQGSSSASSIILNAANGAVQKAGTVLGANSLLLTGSGDWDLAGVGSTNTINSYNDINVFAANISGGLLRFSNNKSFTVGTVNGVNGVTHSSGNTQLYLDRNNGGLTLAQGINSGSIYIRASGGVNQTGGAVVANSLALAGGAVNMTQSGNDLNTIAANINGTFSYTDTDDLKVGSVFSVNGITTSNHDITIKTGNSASYDATKQPSATNPASLVLNETVNAGNAIVRLTAGQGGVYQRHDTDSSGNPLDNGAIKAAGLLMKGSSTTSVTPYVLTNANNRINVLAGSVNGAINYAGAGYSGDTTTVGSIDSTNGLSTSANTVVSSTTNSDGSVTNSYNPNDISLSIGGNLNINQNITASTTNGSDSVSIGIGGDYTAKTGSGIRITADTLGVFGDDSKGSFYLKSKVSNLAASGGKLMVIDNSDYTGSLTALGIGANSSGDIDSAIAAGAAAGGTSSGTISSTDKPVGDFYLTTGGGLNIIKLNSKGQNLMLRSTALDIVLTATTADNARIMLQPFDLSNRIGVNNATESGFTPDINYDAATLLKFTNPVSTFYIGTPQESIFADANVPTAAKNTLTGDVHIGYDGAFNLGYRSLSAQTTGNMVAYNVGPLYNLRLSAPNLTIHSFNTIGDQMHFFSNNLSLPGAASAYVNANKPSITLRTLNDQTVWIGHSYVAGEPQILPSTIVKLPDGSTIIISGTTYYPFPNGGAGYHDIHIPWDDGINLLGNRKLVLSTGHRIYTYNATPLHTEENNGGTSGGLWRGCENLSTCMGSNPSPYPNPDTGSGSTGGGDGGGDSGYTPCTSCEPAPPNTNPYPPTPSTTGDGGSNSGNGNGNGNGGDNSSGAGNNGNGNGSNGSGLSGDGSGDGSNGGGDGGGAMSGGGSGDGSGGSGISDGGNGDGSGGDGSGASSSGSGGDGSGAGGSGLSGDGGGAMGGGGSGDGSGGSGNGDGSGGDGSGTSGSGSGGDGSGASGSGLSGDGSGDGGNGGGDGGASSGSGGNGDGSGDSGTSGGGSGDGSGGDGSNASGAGSGGDGTGDSGSGTGGDGSGDGGNGGGDGGASSGSGGSGDGAGGDGSGADSAGSGSGGDGNGDSGSGAGGNGAGNGDNGGGDGGAGSGSGGTGDGSGGDSNGSGNNGDGRGDQGNGNGSGGDAGGDNGSGSGHDGSGNDGGDGGAGTDSGGSADGNGSASGGTGDGQRDAGDATSGKGDGNGDASAGSGSGGSAKGDTDGSGGNTDGDGASGGEQAPAFDISCDDLQQDDKKDAQKTDAQGSQEMVAVKRDGVKLHTPCQKDTANKSK